MIVSIRSPLAKLETITWEEAGQLPLCLLSRDMENRRIIDRHLEDAGGTREPVLDFDAFFPQYAHVRQGDWASIMPVRFLECSTSRAL